MKNILDYLKERKHLSFTEDPFNEVDGLILAELVYADFNDICDLNTDEDIESVNQKFWNIHSEEEIMSSSAYTKMSPFLMKEMASSIRYKGTRIKNYLSEISLESVTQLAVMTFVLPDGSDFVAFRGTDGSVTGWMEDFMFSYTTTDGQRRAAEYINKYLKGTNRPIRVGGHSKGGNLAVYAASYCESSIQDRIKQVCSYDGPGFMKDVLTSKEYNNILPCIVSIVPKESIIGSIMNSNYKTIITESDSFSILQHDAYQWHIIDNHFEELENRSEVSLFFEKVLNDWLLRFDETKRKEMIESIFSLMLNNNVVTEDNTQVSPTVIYNLIVNTPKLSATDKTLLLNSLQEAFKSTSTITANEIKDMTTGIKDKTIELKDKTIELKDKTIELKDKTIEIKDKTTTIISEAIKSIK